MLDDPILRPRHYTMYPVEIIEITRYLPFCLGKAAKYPPRESTYANDIDTLRASINRHPLKLTSVLTLHVGGANASDTANLFQGRGLTAEMPFASLGAAINFARQNYCGAADVSIVLHADASLTGLFNMTVPMLSSLAITSDSAKRTIAIERGIQLWAGKVAVNNLKLAAGASAFYFLKAMEMGFIEIGQNVEFSGAVSSASITADYCGVIRATNAITGSVTGKRYACSNGGLIPTGGKGPNAIPGTEAGTCDELSVYYQDQIEGSLKIE